MNGLPLIRGYGEATVLGYREGRALRVDAFLRDVLRLAVALPDRRHVLNLCADRYRFAVGFAAALVRGQVSLLPPNQTPDTMERLALQYPELYCLSEDSALSSMMETLVFPELPEEGSERPEIPLIPESHLAAVVFTSGSTGQPVPHPKSWGRLVKGALTEHRRLGSFLASGAAVLGTVPPQHMYGLESTVMLIMQCGLGLHAGRPFYPADIRDHLESLPRPRVLVTTPVHLRVLLAEVDKLPVADLLICATAPLSPQLAAEAERRFAAPLYEIYGCTEAGQIASRRIIDSGEWHALPGVVLRTDSEGTWVRGAHMDGETLLGDVIELLDEEHFLLHGRTADLVNVAGKRTSLAYLNYHLNSIAGVQDGAFVVPANDDDGVPRLMAFVVAPKMAKDEIMSALRRRIDAAFLPRPLCLVDALRRNATGKLPREAIEELMDGITSEAG